MNKTEFSASSPRCTNCGREYPLQGVPYRCPICTGVYDYPVLPYYDPTRVERDQPGLWRYRHALGLPPEAPVISLGEGQTALEWRTLFDRQVAFKLEYTNPTGSYKDRGAAVLVSFLRSRGVTAAVEDSSGNAGAAFAAYAAQAGIQARVFIPDYASGPKRDQVAGYGAELVRVLGSRARTTEATLKAVEAGAVYASHAFLPQLQPGYATLAYELFEQIGRAPGSVIIPAGQGNLLLAVGRGFQALQRQGLIERVPALVGVQALACAPLYAAFHYEAQGLGMVAEGETLAEGVRVRFPVRGDPVLRTVRESQGTFVAVEEQQILPGRDRLKELGFSVEPTSAITWTALEQLAGQLPDPIVLVLTGAGYKSLV